MKVKSTERWMRKGVLVSVYSFYYTFEKRYYVFTQPLGLSVCLSVCLSACHQDCDEMARLSNMVLSEAINPDISSTLQHYQDDPLAGSGSYGSLIQNHILAYNFKTYERIHTKFYLYVIQLGVDHIYCAF